MTATKPPQQIIDRCKARAAAHPSCYVYCAEIDGHWYAYVRKTLRHAKSLLDSGVRVWVMAEPHPVAVVVNRA